jgi:hypothetical protein
MKGFDWQENKNIFMNQSWKSPKINIFSQFLNLIRILVYKNGSEEMEL